MVSFLILFSCYREVAGQVPLFRWHKIGVPFLVVRRPRCVEGAQIGILANLDGICTLQHDRIKVPCPDSAAVAVQFGFDGDPGFFVVHPDMLEQSRLLCRCVAYREFSRGAFLIAIRLLFQRMRGVGGGRQRSPVSQLYTALQTEKLVSIPLNDIHSARSYVVLDGYELILQQDFAAL